VSTATITHSTPKVRRRANRPSGDGRKRRGVAAKAAVETGRNWVIYVRQSKKRKNQRGETTTVSIDVQESMCRDTIAALDPDPRSITLIKDHGRSGVRGTNRPGREQVLTLVESGAVDAVMAFKASRIGRDIEESENFWNRCQDAGAFVAATDCQNLSNPLIRGVYFGMAQQESVDRSEWSLAAADRRREKGLAPIKTCAAFGLRWEGEDLEPDPVEFPVVERIFALFDEGMTAGEIARVLSVERAPRRGVTHGQWERQAVGRIIRTTWYIGLIPDGDTFWDCGRRFVDVDLWNRCTARVELTEDTKRGFSRALSGLLYCGECGGWSPMSLCYSRKKRKDGSVLRRDRYRCIHRERDRDFCEGQSIDSESVELQLIAEIRDSLGELDLAKIRLENRIAETVRATDEGDSTHEAEIERLRDEQRALFNRRQDGEVIPDFLYNEEMAGLEAECSRHERDRERELGSGRLIEATLKRLATELESDPLDPENWMKLPARRRNDFLRLMFPQGITVTKAFNGKSRDVSNRVRPRTAQEAAASEQARLVPSVA
jgi:DNA invertase Pin-like site-specific DNA recombinase